MATPPKPPAKPKSGAATPAPRRSTRKASTAKPASPRTPAKAPPKSDTAAPKTVSATKPASAPTTKPRAKTATTKAAKAPAKSLLAKPATAVKEAAAALPTVDRKTAWSIGAVALAVGAGLTAFLTRGRIGALLSGEAKDGHVPTDLLDPERNKDDRAIADFRPDMDAVMTAAEREALRPATSGGQTGTLN